MVDTKMMITKMMITKIDRSRYFFHNEFYFLITISVNSVQVVSFSTTRHDTVQRVRW